jgi:cytochrome c553
MNQTSWSLEKMNSKTLWVTLAGACLVLSIPAVQAAGDEEAGLKKFYTCGGCHSIAGYNNAVPNYPVPRLGGQHSEAVIAALKSYQDGSRQHGSMQGNASGWTEKDLADIAAYVSKKRLSTETNVITGNPLAGKDKSAACAGCHGEDGNSADPNYPRLAGQYEGYLTKVLKDYSKGVRKNAVMNAMAGALSEGDMKDIAAFYAIQKRGLVTLTD